MIFITAYPERFLTGERPEPAFLIAKPFQPAMVSAVDQPGAVLRAQGQAAAAARVGVTLLLAELKRAPLKPGRAF